MPSGANDCVVDDLRDVVSKIGVVLVQPTASFLEIGDCQSSARLHHLVFGSRQQTRALSLKGFDLCESL
jgi:hypothetical protein